MKRKIKNAIKKFYVMNCLIYIFHNIRSHFKLFLGNIKTTSGTTHSANTIDESIHYITDVFHDYKRIAGIDHFKGRLAEIGPGDNAGVALLFLSDGCTSADLADRFYSKRNADQQSLIYQKLMETSPAIRNLLTSATLNDESSFPKLNRYYGKNAAGEYFFDNHKNYDIIVSRSVLEHLDDPILCLKKMYAALNPGGMLIHKVDLRDHAMFTPHHHDSTFLTVPKWVYNGMTKRTGFPNRILIHRYRDALVTLGCSYKLYVTGLYGVGSLDKECLFSDIPPALKDKAVTHLKRYKSSYANEFKTVSDEDLMVSGFFLKVVKDA